MRFVYGKYKVKTQTRGARCYRKSLKRTKKREVLFQL